MYSVVRKTESLLILLALCACSSFAAYPQVEVHVNPSEANVGDRVQLQLSIVAPEIQNVAIQEPFSKDDNTTWILVDKSSSPAEKINATEYRQVVDYTISPMKTGTVELPKLSVQYKPAHGAARTVNADAPAFTVKSVLPPNANLKELKDIHPPVKLPYPKWIVVTLGLIAAAIAAWIGILIFNKMRGKIRNIVSPPKRLDEWALAEIAAIEQQKLIEHKKTNEFYTRLSDVIRSYLGQLYGFRAMDMTSYELLCALEDFMTSADAHEQVTDLLNEADLVKFAKSQPQPNECRRSLERGRTIVEETRHLLDSKNEEQSASAVEKIANETETAGVQQ
jgi:hypothetical protein